MDIRIHVRNTTLDGQVVDGRVARTGPWVHLPEHRVQLAPADELLWRDGIEPLLQATPFCPFCPAGYRIVLTRE